MPFPLAHPAAVLPLRRLCRQGRLNFSALVVGSLVPDLGYCFGRLHVAEFSHRIIAGAFGFCLPVGCLVWSAFYAVRRPVVGWLPHGYRQALLPLCGRPVGFPWTIGISVLIGAWTHLFLDSMTHPDGWMVEHLSVLHAFVPWVGDDRLRVYEGLYDGCTFCGVGLLVLCYLSWLQTAFGFSRSINPGAKWGCVLLMALATLLLAYACRGARPALGLFQAAAISVLLVLGFLLATRRFFNKSATRSKS